MAQETVSDSVARMLDTWRDQRDASVERLFRGLHESPLLQALVGPAAPGETARPPHVRDEAFEALVEKSWSRRGWRRSPARVAVNLSAPQRRVTRTEKAK